MTPEPEQAQRRANPARTDVEQAALDDAYQKRAHLYVGTHRSPLTVAALSILTIGLYVPFFLIAVCDDLNKALGEDRLSPWWAVISSLCLPFLTVVWLVRIAFALSDAASARNLQVLGGANLALVTILLPPAGLYLLQSGLNTLWEEAPK